MELYKRLKPDFELHDTRGTLVQLVHEGYEQINVLTTRAGVVRGGHYHKETVEAFFVVDGQVEIELEKDAVRHTEIFEKGELFCIPPFVWHTMRFGVDTVLVAMYERAVEKADGTKDIFSQ